MKWELYEDGPTRPPNERMHVSINYKGVIFINARTFELMGFPESVLLMFDRARGVIGVNPASSSRANTFRVQAGLRGRHRTIRAAPFCRFFGIRIDNTQVFLQPELDEEGVLRLDLGAITRSRMSNRSRKR
jgi:hypothetical protein